MSAEVSGGLEVPIEISVVCQVGGYAGDLAAIHREFRTVLAATGRQAEFLYVLNGPHPAAEESLRGIVEKEYPVRVFRMAKGFGEAAALQYGFDHSRGRYIVTVPDRFQVAPEAVLRILERLDEGVEVVVTRREARRDSLLNRLQSRMFHALVRTLSKMDFRDLTCGLRGLTREAALRLDLYGELQRFIPILAARQGFRVTEIPVDQRKEDLALRLFWPGVYARRLLDILNVFFLTRFLVRPLRFFGLLGMVLGFAGFAISASLAVMKLMGKTALSNRPLLLLGVLLIVLGVQVISIGLVGEIIIFLAPRRQMAEVDEIDGEKE